MSAAEWIAKRRELLDDASEGPWFQGREDHRYESAHEVYSKREPDEEGSHDIASYVWSAEDAALMVDARTSLPIAVDALEAVLALADNPYPDARNISGADIKRAVESVLRGES